MIPLYNNIFFNNLHRFSNNPTSFPAKTRQLTFNRYKNAAAFTIIILTNQRLKVEVLEK